MNHCSRNHGGGIFHRIRGHQGNDCGQSHESHCGASVTLPAASAPDFSETRSENIHRIYNEGKRPEAAAVSAAPKPGVDRYYYADGMLYTAAGKLIAPMALDPKAQLTGKDHVDCAAFFRDSKGENWSYLQRGDKRVLVDHRGRERDAEILIGPPPGTVRTFERSVADVIVNDPKTGRERYISRHVGNVIVYRSAAEVESHKLNSADAAALFDGSKTSIKLHSGKSTQDYNVERHAENDSTEYVYLRSADGSDAVRIGRSRADGSFTLERQVHVARNSVDSSCNRIFGNAGWVIDQRSSAHVEVPPITPPQTTPGTRPPLPTPPQTTPPGGLPTPPQNTSPTNPPQPLPSDTRPTEPLPGPQRTAEPLPSLLRSADPLPSTLRPSTIEAATSGTALPSELRPLEPLSAGLRPSTMDGNLSIDPPPSVLRSVDPLESALRSVEPLSGAIRPSAGTADPFRDDHSFTPAPGSANRSILGPYTPFDPLPGELSPLEPLPSALRFSVPLPGDLRPTGPLPGAAHGESAEPFEAPPLLNRTENPETPGTVPARSAVNPRTVERRARRANPDLALVRFPSTPGISDPDASGNDG